MKKLIAVVLCCVMVMSLVSCSFFEVDISKEKETKPEGVSSASKVEDENGDIETQIAKKLDDFNGIVYLTDKNGKVIYSGASGKDEKGNALSVSSPMFIGSVSKQFCAAAILMLSEQGKLSIEDTLDKYFPQYESGKKVTIKNLLSMRSGIPEMLDHLDGVSVDKTESENIQWINEWVYEQPFDFEPDTQLAYSNTNYLLHSQIVEKDSGEYYSDFIRKNIFEPLEMNDSGFVLEVEDNEFFSKSLTYDTFEFQVEQAGAAKGAGDIVSTAADMDKWMKGLVNGKIISEENYQEMIKDHSPDNAEHYGYGIMGFYKKGKGHSGRIGTYLSLDYISTDEEYYMFASTNETDNKIMNIPALVMDILTDK